MAASHIHEQLRDAVHGIPKLLLSAQLEKKLASLGFRDANVAGGGHGYRLARNRRSPGPVTGCRKDARGHAVG